LSRTGVNYKGNTLQFYMLLLQHIDTEAKNCINFAQQAQLHRIQSMMQATSSEQASAVSKAYQEMIERVLSPQDSITKVKEPSEAQEFSKKKAYAIQVLAQDTKGFSSLAEIMSAVKNHIGS
jgi:hypothetical protein